MDKYFKKRSVIIFVYLTLFVFLGVISYYLFRPAPTCFDGLKNQNEEDVDCGGVCEKKCSEKIEAADLVVEKSGAVPAGLAGKYDFYALIRNPNTVYGSKKFEYKLILKGSSGEILAQKNGWSYILPGESKYIVENNIEAEDVPSSANLEIISSQWVEFNSYYERPDIKIVNKNYNEISGGTGFSEAKGLLKNSSPFDFDLIKIEVILKDSGGKVLALNSTEMKTVKSGEQRDFTLFWPNSFPGTVGNMEVEAQVNVFDSDTFLKRFYKAEKFQEY